MGRRPGRRGAPAPFSVVDHELPVDELDEEFPLRLTTGRRLDSYNTGRAVGRLRSPLRREEAIDLSPEDAGGLGVDRRRDGAGGLAARLGDAPVRVDPALRPGLAFMTPHFPDEVDTNSLTIEATDPSSGTAEFKATAIRVEKVSATDGG